MNILTNLDLNRNELQNAVVQNLAVPPANAKLGQIYFDTVNGTLCQYDGSSWNPVGAPYVLPIASASELGGVKIGAGLVIASDGTISVNGGGTADSVEWSGVLHKPTTIAGYGITDAKITGQKVTLGSGEVTVPTKASELQNDVGYLDSVPSEYVTDSELATALTPYLQKSGGTMTGDITMGSHKVTGLTDGTASSDAVTYGQLQSAIAGLGTVFNLKGSKATTAQLPTTGNTIGDVWFVESESVGYIWLTDSTHPNGKWEKFGPEIDLSGYLTKAGLAQTTGSATNNAMSQKAVSDALALKANADDIPPTIKQATGTISTSQTSVTVNFTGTLVGVYVKQSDGEHVLCDIASTASSVTAAVAQEPTSALTVVVTYFA